MTTTPTKVLIIDEDFDFLDGLSRELESKKFSVGIANRLSGLRRSLEGSTFDIVVIGSLLGNDNRTLGIELVREYSPASRLFLIESLRNGDTSAKPIVDGVAGIIEKRLGIEGVVAEIRRCCSTDSTMLPHDQIPPLDLGIIGRSDGILQVIEKIQKLSQVDSSILIYGESGTGKELIAHAIHNTSKRSHHRFSAINCSAIPEALLETELFGHKKGSFTDAKTDRKGIFELSSNGTLFLDEIGDMPLGLQAKLLRVLQEKEITPVGSSQAVKIDTRIIAATHHNLRSEAEQHQFREDLYYRLSVIVIQLPPLRSRVEDIPLLFAHFLRHFNQRFSREVNMPCQSDMELIMDYHWPGNIRELQNSIERAVVMSVDGRINMSDIFTEAVRQVGSFIEPELKVFNDSSTLEVLDSKAGHGKTESANGRFF
ncbi:MAG: sigma-54 dependent transcriptional regulator, partial [Proteobacteria bacterium]|nr:sigma-54 dependent transcriptional regulator [Pseudomonadota bacterium]